MPNVSFDYIFNTSELGVAKPDPAVFRIILGRVGVAPEEAFFVDNHPENVAAATTLGIAAHLYEDAATLGRALADAGFSLASA